MTGLTLDVRDVTKRFGHGETAVAAVRGVSIAVAPGEIVLIMGPSGSGKTTLLSMMGALLRPTEGSIHLDGAAISELSEGRLPDIRLRQFGFIFQDFNLLSALTVLENVAIVAELAGAKRPAARDRATALLSDLGLAERLDFLPEQLSGGEKQRVAIARALVNDPMLILADQRIRDIADRVLWLEDGQFRDAVTMATDPVCGMSIERERSVSATHAGETFYFCSRGCRDEHAGALGPGGRADGPGFSRRIRMADASPDASLIES